MTGSVPPSSSRLRILERLDHALADTVAATGYPVLLIGMDTPQVDPGHLELAVQESWFGLWAPGKTPADIVAVLHAATAKTAQTASVSAAFEAAGNEVAHVAIGAILRTILHGHVAAMAELEDVVLNAPMDAGLVGEALGAGRAPPLGPPLGPRLGPPMGRG